MIPQKNAAVNIFGIIAAVLVSLVLTVATTPDIGDYKIDMNVSALVARFGLTAVLVYLVFSILDRLRARRKADKPTLD